MNPCLCTPTASSLFILPFWTSGTDFETSWISRGVWDPFETWSWSDSPGLVKPWRTQGKFHKDQMSVTGPRVQKKVTKMRGPELFIVLLWEIAQWVFFSLVPRDKGSSSSSLLQLASKLLRADSIVYLRRGRKSSLLLNSIMNNDPSTWKNNPRYSLGSCKFPSTY